MIKSDARQAAFRHDPVNLVLGTGSARSVRWDKEPALCGYAKLTHFSERLKREIAVPVCATPLVVLGKGAIVGSYDGRVRLFSEDLSGTIWEDRMSAAIYSTPVAVGVRGIAIVASTNGEVIALSPDGKRLWRAELGSPVYASPTFLPQADIAVFCCFGGRCFGVNVEDGTIEFARDLPRPWSSAFGGKAAHRDPYASPVATDLGHVVVCCADSVICFASDGALLWRRDLDAAIRASPMFLGVTAEVSVATTNGDCVFLNAATGEIAHKWSATTKIVGSPASSGDFVLIGDVDGEATCIHAPSRAVAWRRSHASPKDHSSYTITPVGDFIATNGRGNVLCLGREDGRFLWETSQLLGLAEHDPALDATPIASADGGMYCGSYSGFVYFFRFQPSE